MQKPSSPWHPRLLLEVAPTLTIFSVLMSLGCTGQALLLVKSISVYYCTAADRSEQSKNHCNPYYSRGQNGNWSKNWLKNVTELEQTDLGNSYLWWGTHPTKIIPLTLLELLIKNYLAWAWKNWAFTMFCNQGIIIMAMIPMIFHLFMFKWVFNLLEL